MRVSPICIAAMLPLALAACAPVAADNVGPQDRFFAALSDLCGQAFAGTVETDRDAEGREAGADSAFAAGPVVMHVRDCEADVVRIPLHVGEDRSRTWVVSRTENGLRLKHDHRHDDGSEDAVTQYGGDTEGAGTAGRQAFPVDAYSIALFQREGLTASLRNSWAMEIAPGDRFVYELARPTGRLFRLSFDLSVPVPLPPTAWGYEPS